LIPLKGAGAFLVQKVCMIAHANDTKLPGCPGCSKAMIVVRSWPALGAIPSVQSYECRDCGIVCSAADFGDETIADQIAAQYIELYTGRQKPAANHQNFG
jgi:hypothetical protein